MKIAVLGDNFAQLDARAGHWVKLWADRDDHEVDFLGLTGSNMVEICEHARVLDFDKYDLLIVYVTDLQRFSTRTPGKIDLLETQDAEFVRDHLRLEAANRNVTAGHGFGDAVRQTPHSIKDGNEADDLYRIYLHLSGTWLAAANHAAVEGLEAYLAKQGVPVVWILPPMGGATKPWCKLKNVWDMDEHFDRSYKPTKSNEDENAASLNSFGAKWHKAALVGWDYLMDSEKIRIR